MMTTRKAVLAILIGGLVIGLPSVGDAEIILGQTTDTTYGLYEGAYWKLSDAGFTSSGDTLTQTVNLTSVGFTSRGSSATAGDLYLKVFTGNTGGLGTYVGISSNTVDFAGLSAQSVGTWTFAELSLDKDTDYSYIVGLNNDSSNPIAKIGIKIGLQLSGTTLNSDTPTGGGYDPVLHITAVPIPEPSTLMLMLLGGAAIMFRRRFRRN